MILAAVPFARPAQNILKARFGSGVFVILTLAFIPIGIELFRRFIIRPTDGRRQRLAWFIVLTIIYIQQLQSLKIDVERFHLLEYGFLAGFLALAFSRHDCGYLSYGWALAGVMLVGLADEFYQFLTPNRYGEFRDVLINVKGGILGLLVLGFLIRDPSFRKPASLKSISSFLIACSLLAFLSCTFFLHVQTFGYMNVDSSIGRFRSYFSRDYLKNLYFNQYAEWIDAVNGQPPHDPQGPKKLYWYDREASEHLAKMNLAFQQMEFDSASREYKILCYYFGHFITFRTIQFDPLMARKLSNTKNSLKEDVFTSDVVNFIITSVNARQVEQLRWILSILILSAGVVCRVIETQTSAQKSNSS